MGLLRKLHTLLLDENALTVLAPELGSCHQLSLLSVRNNHLTQLPAEVIVFFFKKPLSGRFLYFPLNEDLHSYDLSTYVSAAVRKVYPISVFSVFNCEKSNGADSFFPPMENPIRNRPRPQNHTFVSPTGKLREIIFFIIYLIPYSITDLSNTF